MATAKKETAEKTTTYESKYGIEELAAAAKDAFGTNAIVVRAALKLAGKTEYTMPEAEKIVNKFKSKEVQA